MLLRLLLLLLFSCCCISLSPLPNCNLPATHPTPYHPSHLFCCCILSWLNPALQTPTTLNHSTPLCQRVSQVGGLRALWWQGNLKRWEASHSLSAIGTSEAGTSPRQRAHARPWAAPNVGWPQAGRAAPQVKPKDQLHLTSTRLDDSNKGGIARPPHHFNPSLSTRHPPRRAPPSNPPAPATPATMTRCLALLVLATLACAATAISEADVLNFALNLVGGGGAREICARRPGWAVKSPCTLLPPRPPATHERAPCPPPPHDHLLSGRCVCGGAGL